MGSENLFVKCNACGKEIHKSSKICPHCGNKNKKNIILWFVIILIALFFIGMFNDPVDSISPQASDSIVETISQSQIEVEIPINEKQFISAVEKYVDKFNGAKNELQQSLLRDQRKKDISRLINSMHIKSWVGTISQLSTNSEGKGILSVRISPIIRITTWNNALSDITADTLIDKGTSVYEKLLPLSIGRKIKFSGRFFPSESDSIQETSVTIHGSITSPEFLFKFYSIELIKD